MIELAKRTLFINPNIEFLSNSTIVEYDMKDAGFSLIKKYDMLPKEKIKELEDLGNKKNEFDKKYWKHKKDEAIGKLQRKDRSLSDKLKVAFEIERESFIKKNDLSEDQIISIKKDAFFLNVKGKKIDGKIDEYINFRKKNEYTSYLYIKPIEIYFNYEKGMDIKGIGDDQYNLHKDYMIKFINRVLHEYETRDITSVLYTIRTFIDQYKSLSLDSGYYREFNASSKFVYLDGEMSEIEYREDKEELNIMHNYNITIELLMKIMNN